MNFFKLYIGDFERDTGSLTAAEEGIYFRLLRAYYASEAPLPSGKRLYAIARASTTREKAALDHVLKTFWKPAGTGYENPRAKKEIAKAQEIRLQNKEIGKLGGRPKKTESVSESVSNRLANDNPNQTPDTSNQTKKENNPPMSPLEPARAASPQDYFFRGKVFRVSVHDAQRWKEVYNLVPDLRAELEAADAYYADNPPKNGKWYFAVSNWLKRVHVAAQQKQEEERRAKRTWN
jgi:uncharacterized protein YdaU (DUF1376 family)